MSGVFAIVKTGGKQYRVFKDLTLSIDLLKGDTLEKGSKIVFDKSNENRKVLFYCSSENNEIDLSASSVEVHAEIVEPDFKGEKVYIFKKRRRKHSKTKGGFRARHTKIKILEIKKA